MSVQSNFPILHSPYPERCTVGNDPFAAASQRSSEREGKILRREEDRSFPEESTTLDLELQMKEEWISMGRELFHSSCSREVSPFVTLELIANTICDPELSSTGLEGLNTARAYPIFHEYLAKVIADKESPLLRFSSHLACFSTMLSSDDIETTIAAIKETLKNDGEVFFPTGWEGHGDEEEGHAMVAWIAKEASPRIGYRFGVFNSGCGIDFHLCRNGEKEKYYPLFSKREIDEKEITNQLLEKFLKLSLYCVDPDTYSIADNSDQVIYKILFGALNGKTDEEPWKEVDVWCSAGASGTCVAKSFFCTLKYLIHRDYRGNESFYREVKKKFQQQLFIDFLSKYKPGYNPGKERRLLKMIHRRLSIGLRRDSSDSNSLSLLLYAETLFPKPIVRKSALLSIAAEKFSLYLNLNPSSREESQPLFQELIMSRGRASDAMEVETADFPFSFQSETIDPSLLPQYCESLDRTFNELKFLLPTASFKEERTAKDDLTAPLFAFESQCLKLFKKMIRNEKLAELSSNDSPGAEEKKKLLIDSYVKNFYSLLSLLKEKRFTDSPPMGALLLLDNLLFGIYSLFLSDYPDLASLGFSLIDWSLLDDNSRFVLPDLCDEEIFLPVESLRDFHIEKQEKRQCVKLSTFHKSLCIEIDKSRFLRKALLAKFRHERTKKGGKEICLSSYLATDEESDAPPWFAALFAPWLKGSLTFQAVWDNEINLNSAGVQYKRREGKYLLFSGSRPLDHTIPRHYKISSRCDLQQEERENSYGIARVSGHRSGKGIDFSARLARYDQFDHLSLEILSHLLQESSIQEAQSYFCLLRQRFCQKSGQTTSRIAPFSELYKAEEAKSVVHSLIQRVEKQLPLLGAKEFNAMIDHIVWLVRALQKGGFSPSIFFDWESWSACFIKHPLDQNGAIAARHLAEIGIADLTPESGTMAMIALLCIAERRRAMEKNGSIYLSDLDSPLLPSMLEKLEDSQILLDSVLSRLLFVRCAVRGKEHWLVKSQGVYCCEEYTFDFSTKCPYLLHSSEGEICFGTTSPLSFVECEMDLPLRTFLADSFQRPAEEITIPYLLTTKEGNRVIHYSQADGLGWLKGNHTNNAVIFLDKPRVVAALQTFEKKRKISLISFYEKLLSTRFEICPMWFHHPKKMGGEESYYVSEWFLHSDLIKKLCRTANPLQLLGNRGELLCINVEEEPSVYLIKLLDKDSSRYTVQDLSDGSYLAPDAENLPELASLTSLNKEWINDQFKKLQSARLFVDDKGDVVKLEITPPLRRDSAIPSMTFAAENCDGAVHFLSKQFEGYRLLLSEGALPENLPKTLLIHLQKTAPPPAFTEGKSLMESPDEEEITLLFSNDFSEAVHLHLSNGEFLPKDIDDTARFALLLSQSGQYDLAIDCLKRADPREQLSDAFQIEVHKYLEMNYLTDYFRHRINRSFYAVMAHIVRHFNLFTKDSQSLLSDILPDYLENISSIPLSFRLESSSEWRLLKVLSERNRPVAAERKMRVEMITSSTLKESAAPIEKMKYFNSLLRAPFDSLCAFSPDIDNFSLEKLSYSEFLEWGDPSKNGFSCVKEEFIGDVVFIRDLDEMGNENPMDYLPPFSIFCLYRLVVDIKMERYERLYERAFLYKFYQLIYFQDEENIEPDSYNILLWLACNDLELLEEMAGQLDWGKVDENGERLSHDWRVTYAEDEDESEKKEDGIESEQLNAVIESYFPLFIERYKARFKKGDRELNRVERLDKFQQMKLLPRPDLADSIEERLEKLPNIFTHLAQDLGWPTLRSAQEGGLYFASIFTRYFERGSAPLPPFPRDSLPVGDAFLEIEKSIAEIAGNWPTVFSSDVRFALRSQDTQEVLIHLAQDLRQVVHSTNERLKEMKRAIEYRINFHFQTEEASRERLLCYAAGDQRIITVEELLFWYGGDEKKCNYTPIEEYLESYLELTIRGEIAKKAHGKVENALNKMEGPSQEEIHEIGTLLSSRRERLIPAARTVEMAEKVMIERATLYHSAQSGMNMTALQAKIMSESYRGKAAVEAPCGSGKSSFISVLSAKLFAKKNQQLFLLIVPESLLASNLRELKHRLTAVTNKSVQSLQVDLEKELSQDAKSPQDKRLGEGELAARKIIHAFEEGDPLITTPTDIRRFLLLFAKECKTGRADLRNLWAMTILATKTYAMIDEDAVCLNPLHDTKIGLGTAIEVESFHSELPLLIVETIEKLHDAPDKWSHSIAHGVASYIGSHDEETIRHFLEYDEAMESEEAMNQKRELEEWLSCRTEKERAILFLARAYLRHYLPTALFSLEQYIDYGLAEGRPDGAMQAVPFEGPNLPMKSGRFSIFELESLLTILCYHRLGLKSSHLSLLFSDWRKLVESHEKAGSSSDELPYGIPEAVRRHFSGSKRKFLSFNSNDAASMKRVASSVGKDRETINLFLLSRLLPSLVTSNEKIAADAGDLRTTLFSKLFTMSGTANHPVTAPNLRVWRDQKALYRPLVFLFDEKTCPVVAPSEQDFLNLPDDPSLHAIADPTAVRPGKSADEEALEWLKKLEEHPQKKNYTLIYYSTKGNEKCGINSRTKGNPFLVTSYDEKSSLIFFDAQHCVGADFNMPSNASMALYLRETQSGLSSALLLQTIQRMRLLGRGQRVEIRLHPALVQRIRKELSLPEERAIDGVLLYCWTTLCEQRINSSKVQRALLQETAAKVKREFILHALKYREERQLQGLYRNFCHDNRLQSYRFLGSLEPFPSFMERYSEATNCMLSLYPPLHKKTLAMQQEKLFAASLPYLGDMEARNGRVDFQGVEVSIERQTSISKERCTAIELGDEQEQPRTLLPYEKIFKAGFIRLLLNASSMAAGSAHRRLFSATIKERHLLPALDILQIDHFFNDLWFTENFAYAFAKTSHSHLLTEGEQRQKRLELHQAYLKEAEFFLLFSDEIGRQAAIAMTAWEADRLLCLVSKPANRSKLEEAHLREKLHLTLFSKEGRVSLSIGGDVDPSIIDSFRVKALFLNTNETFGADLAKRVVAELCRHSSSLPLLKEWYLKFRQRRLSSQNKLTIPLKYTSLGAAFSQIFIHNGERAKFTVTDQTKREGTRKRKR